MQKKDIQEILNKVNSGNYTAEEEAIAKYWLHQLNQDDQVNFTEEEMVEIGDQVWARLQQEELQRPVKVQKLWPRIAVTAAAVAAVVFGVWFYYAPRNPGAGQDSESAQYANDIAPGKNTATLTLANGRVITLSDDKTGVIIDANKLSYNDGTEIDPTLTKGIYNNEIRTIATPRGGTYQVILPDRSLVVLNAASSIKFPSTFTGLPDRKVELQGEGYFEIFKDKKHPFVVLSKNQDVTVLGTHFNISTYEDEAAVKTTLLEGSVSVRHAEFISASRNRKANMQEEIILKPGQQSSLSSDKLKVEEVDVNEVVAWKNSYFRFTDERIDVIMTKLARWYDIEVIYEGDIPTERFNAAISGNKNISQVLNVLAKTNAVRFKITGRKVTVNR